MTSDLILVYRDDLGDYLLHLNKSFHLMRYKEGSHTPLDRNQPTEIYTVQSVQLKEVVEQVFK